MPVDPETVKEILAAASRAVKEAGVPAELQDVAYAKAVDLFAAEAGISHAPGKEKQSKQGSGAKKEATPASGGEISTGTLEQIASVLSVDSADVEEAYHLVEDELKISFNASQLANANSDATRQVALLLAAGRQSGGWDSGWTGTKVIRAACDELRVFDSGNFATTIKAMTREFSFSGQGRNRKVKVTRRGNEDAADLIRELTGGDT